MVMHPPGQGVYICPDQAKCLTKRHWHLALEVVCADQVVFSGLRTLLLDDGSMVADGGGYNEH